MGAAAEALVAQWLMAQGWQILHRRWHCQWGELDLVAYSGTSPAQSHCSSAILAFVEVKARSRGNWDANGLLAITPQKQAKLWQAAQLFLAEQPDLEELPCRFDVALVRGQRLRPTGQSEPLSDRPLLSMPVKLGEVVAIGSYRLSLQQYIQSAFEG
jgi:putative endonuclease